MYDLKFYYLLLTALIPMITGAIWYSKPLFAGAWMKAAEVSEEKLKKGNMALILILTYILSLLISLALMPVVIHQLGVFSVLVEDPAISDPASEVSLYMKDFLERYGTNYRTFKHGAYHGILTGLFLAGPFISINALFERRNFKYIAIHTGYWVLTLSLMGGIICALV